MVVCVETTSEWRGSASTWTHTQRERLFMVKERARKHNQGKRRKADAHKDVVVGLSSLSSNGEGTSTLPLNRGSEPFLAVAHPTAHTHAHTHRYTLPRHGTASEDAFVGIDFTFPALITRWPIN